MSFHKDFYQVASNTQEAKVIKILNNTLRDLVKAYDKYSQPNHMLFRDTETSILKAIQNIDGRTPIDRNFA